MNRFLKVKIL